MPGDSKSPGNKIRRPAYSNSNTRLLVFVFFGSKIAFGGGYVWVRGSTTLLYQIDPQTNQVVRRYGPVMGSGGVAADDSAVWITAHDSTTIWRLPLE